MKEGDIITIYHDPWTEQNVEGQAQLLSHVDAGKKWELDYWEVKFLDSKDGDPNVCRFIKKK
jgi:hypothetical protein